MPILLELFLKFFKIGAVSFGGGYAMVAIIENELVEKKKLFSHDEFLDMLAIAESTPGPIAINTATFIGYKRCGVLGSIFCTLGVVIPSFVIIFIISLFYEQFLALKWVTYAFKGIQVCVVFLIFNAGLKMFIKMKKTPVSVGAVILVVVLMVGLGLFSKNVSSIYYILVGGIVGVISYAIIIASKKIKKTSNEKENK